jgi:hypothetical protein
MTESYSPGPSRGGQESTAQTVREQAAGIGQDAAQASGRVAQTAVEQGKEVVQETRAQGRNLLNEATSELSHQASMQQKRAAEGLRALASDLRSMTGRSEQSGMASDLVDQAARKAHQAADWLEHRQPGQVVDEVRAFARRRPGAFLAGAVVAGVVVGRLTRNLPGTSGPGTGTGTRETYPRSVGEMPTSRLGAGTGPAVPPVGEGVEAVVAPARPGGSLPGEVRP